MSISPEDQSSEKERIQSILKAKIKKEKKNKKKKVYGPSKQAEKVATRQLRRHPHGEKKRIKP